MGAAQEKWVGKQADPGKGMKILYLEDNCDDAVLFGNVIRDEWPECNIEEASDRDSFLARLAGEPYDLILSDYSIAGFDGLVALEAAHAKTPDTPFIFLSGTIGEDRAVEAMRQGAADYVLKDRPKRLIPAIRRALVHAEQVHKQRATEAQLLHVQRLENIGMLAAGIAHDFNNVLAPILMGIPLVREHIADPETAAILSNMEASVRHGAGLVQQILDFAQGDETPPQIVQPNAIVRELLNVIRQTFPKNIKIEERVAGDLWLLEANPTLLHQLFLNLCVNARDAMPGGGVLRFAAGNRHVDRAGAVALQARPGRHLVFEVSDTGTGILPENLARIWQPFFTTKEVGRGTGLGLPTVRRIVDLHHGAITIQSEPGKGTTFTVYLPAAASGVATSGEMIQTPPHA
jgi:signal transduction histidine kinase